MNRLQIVLVVASVVCLGLENAVGGPEHDHGATAKQQADFAAVMPKCPVTDEPVDFNVKTYTEGGPVYFCCKGCIDKYRANPGKYAAKVSAQRAALAKLPKVQVLCPVTGKLVDGKTSIDHNGEKVSFCCPKCVAKFNENSAKYKTVLANSYTYQTKCPVMGGDIDPQSFTTLAGGQRIYFCCPGCEAPLFKDPAKYASKLAAQGFKIKPEQIKPAKEDKDGAHGHDHDDHGHGGHDHDDH
ncbi:MAG: hypothetical protein ACYSUI_05995 [Planctomycetota bacterium]